MPPGSAFGRQNTAHSTATPEHLEVGQIPHRLQDVHLGRVVVRSRTGDDAC